MEVFLTCRNTQKKEGAPLLQWLSIKRSIFLVQKRLPAQRMMLGPRLKSQADILDFSPVFPS